MQILNFTQARAGLKELMEDVTRDHEPTVITNQRGKAVVMVSLEDFNSMQETLYLLSSTKNAQRLRSSIAKIKAGQVSLQELIHDREAETT